MRLGALALWIWVALLSLTSPVAAKEGEARLALVIANGEYRAFDRLSETDDDGERIAKALSATGFSDAVGKGQVQVRRNLDLAVMRKEIEAFRTELARLGPNSFGVLYFSGHGVALGPGGDVLMVPVDASRSGLAEVLSLSRAKVTRDLMLSGAGNILVVLDMCRNAVDVPLPQVEIEGLDLQKKDEISGAKGLRRILRNQNQGIRPEQGYLVAYSTSTDSVAFDNGAFSQVLAEEIQRPRQNIAEALKRTSDRVALRSGTAFQKPTFDYGLQGSPPCFVSCDPDSGNRFYDCANCPWMVALPAGQAYFGSPANEKGRDRDESLQERRDIKSGFALAVFELTIAEWTACVNEGACARITDWTRENPNPLIPASGISFEDAESYVRWLSARSGRRYRLPTEVEWEYASRAQADTAFPWGKSIAPSDANYDHTVSYEGSPKAPYRGYPEAVTAYPPNRFGLYQMQGNVWEWTGGCMDEKCSARTLRGGSFESVPNEMRSANRFGQRPRQRNGTVGLRVARDLDADEIIAKPAALVPR